MGKLLYVLLEALYTRLVKCVSIMFDKILQRY